MLFYSFARRILIGQIIVAAPALAAGGAHVVDDAAVETPGTCHFENWATLATGPSGLLNISPACTRKTWPNIELGASFTHSWAAGARQSQIGLTPKFLLRSEDAGVGVGVATSLAYGTGSGRFEAASVIVPITVPVTPGLRINLNAGWQWVRSAGGHALFVGAQSEIKLTGKLNLMVEIFARDQGKVGSQVGLRWTPGKSNFDIDLLGGRYLDGITRTAITVGITVRR